MRGFVNKFILFLGAASLVGFTVFLSTHYDNIAPISIVNSEDGSITLSCPKGYIIDDYTWECREDIQFVERPERVAYKGKAISETNQITKELINLWWDGSIRCQDWKKRCGKITYLNIGLICEKVYQVVEVHPSIGEKAFIAVCYTDRARASGLSSSLIIRPKYKEAREYMNLYDGLGGSGKDILKVTDIEQDGISEIVIGEGYLATGVLTETLMVVTVKGWLPNILFRKSTKDCSGMSLFAYLHYPEFCKFGYPVNISFDFEDLNGDGVLDLIETVNYYEGFNEVSMEEGKKLEGCWSEMNEKFDDFTDCWKKVMPGTPVRDLHEITLKMDKTINRYLFNNGAFEPIQVQ